MLFDQTIEIWGLSVQADIIAEKKKLADKKQDQLRIIGSQGKASWELLE